MWFALLCDLVAGIELVVLPLEGEQFVVPSPLYDPTMVKDHYVVCILDGGKPVGYDECSPSLHEGIHAFLDQFLGPGVD